MAIERIHASLRPTRRTAGWSQTRRRRFLSSEGHRRSRGSVTWPLSRRCEVAAFAADRRNLRQLAECGCAPLSDRTSMTKGKAVA